MLGGWRRVGDAIDAHGRQIYSGLGNAAARGRTRRRSNIGAKLSKYRYTSPLTGKFQPWSASGRACRQQYQPNRSSFPTAIRLLRNPLFEVPARQQLYVKHRRRFEQAPTRPHPVKMLEALLQFIGITYIMLFKFRWDRFRRYTFNPESDLPDLTGKVAIVTGSK